MKLLPLLIIGTFNISNLIGQQKKIFIAPDDHTDYMWSGDETEYKQAFLKTLDYYIKINDSTASEPYPYQSKWNCDGSYWIYTYEKNKTRDEFDKLITQIRDRKITVPLNTLVGLHGVAPLEATLRDMYYAGSLERRFGLNLDLAFSMEDHTMPLGLSSLFAGSGAKYSWRGVCVCGTKVTGFESRPHQMYWYKGLDDQKILMKWYSADIDWVNKIKGCDSFLGTYQEARTARKGIIDCKKLMENTDKYPYDIAAAFGKGGDDLMTKTDEFTRAAKDYTDSVYQIIVSNEIDFFEDFEKKYGSSLPSETITYGSPEWGYNIASLAAVSASVKRAVEKLRSAEALYTLVSLKDKKFAAGLSEMKERAWVACGLYFEHCWTSEGYIISKKQRADWQRKIAGELISYVDTLYDLSIARLGELIKNPAKNSETFFVFNPLSWTRSDYNDYPYSGSQTIKVVDMNTSREVPFQFIVKKNEKFIRIFAEEIPPLGYKVYKIEKGNPLLTTKLAATVTENIIENDYYKITINQFGVITSLIDKVNNNYEYVREVNNLYSNDMGTDQWKTGSSLDNWKNGCSPLRIENAGPVSVTLIAESYRPLKHISKITLYKSCDRIEIENYLTQNLDIEPVTYAFSFNLDKPEIWHEETGAILKASHQLQDGHYAEMLCRLDYLTLNHFADISDESKGMTISNRDAYQMKTGNSTTTKLDCATPQIKVLAAGQIDAPVWGVVNQDGDSYFENFFALKAHNERFDAPSSMKFSLEHQNPLISGSIKRKSLSFYESQFSLFSVSDPKILVWSVKPAEEGIDAGIVLRVWNMDNQDRACTISSAFPIIRCTETTHIENDLSEITPDDGLLKTTIGHNRIQTFRIFLKVPLKQYPTKCR